MGTSIDIIIFHLISKNVVTKQWIVFLQDLFVNCSFALKGQIIIQFGTCLTEIQQSDWLGAVIHQFSKAGYDWNERSRTPLSKIFKIPPGGWPLFNVIIVGLSCMHARQGAKRAKHEWNGLNEDSCCITGVMELWTGSYHVISWCSKLYNLQWSWGMATSRVSGECIN